LILRTRAPTLIPRPETAHIFTHLAQNILNSILHSNRPQSGILRLADICTGSGCIALLLSHLLQAHNTKITGYDISTEAIELAKENAKLLDIEDRVEFKYGDIFNHKTMGGEGRGKVDMIVSNPPYIPRLEWEGLPHSVKSYEDSRALIGDPSDLPGAHVLGKAARGEKKGLAFYRRIAEILPDVQEEDASLRDRGWEGLPRVAVEVGMGQAQEVRAILESVRGVVRRTEIWNDQFGVERMVVGWGKS
jgi:release factor glutamine methyltransferase